MNSPFLQRHLGPSDAEQQQMLQTLGYQQMDAFIKDVVPDDILDAAPPRDMLPAGCGEAEALADLGTIAAKNLVQRSLIGLG